MAPLDAPRQLPITLDAIREMLEWSPRRCMLAREWQDLLHPSSEKYDSPSIVLPFYETLGPSFDVMVDVPHIGVRRAKDGRRAYSLMKVPDGSPELEKIQVWHKTVGRYVAIRDRLALSYALDYDRTGGNPAKPHTRVAKLRVEAKPYGRPATDSTLKAADRLIEACGDFLSAVTCYRDLDAIVAMPPSDPAKEFDLPKYLAAGVARAAGIDDLSGTVTTRKRRPALKDTPRDAKLETLKGTIEVDTLPDGARILLVDDLYQSGVSMNYVAKLLLAAGAGAVYGLAVEKTCRNDDNV